MKVWYGRVLGQLTLGRCISGNLKSPNIIILQSELLDCTCRRHNGGYNLVVALSLEVYASTASTPLMVSGFSTDGV